MTQGKNTLYESYAGTYNSKGVFLKINKKPQQTLLVTSLLTDGRPAALAHSPSLMTEKVVWKKDFQIVFCIKSVSFQSLSNRPLSCYVM